MGLLSALDRTLGTLVARASGVVFGLFAFGAGSALVSAVQEGEWVAAAVLASATGLLVAATWPPFRPGRRLTDLEP